MAGFSIAATIIDQFVLAGKGEGATIASVIPLSPDEQNLAIGDDGSISGDTVLGKSPVQISYTIRNNEGLSPQATLTISIDWGSVGTYMANTVNVTATIGGSDVDIFPIANDESSAGIPMLESVNAFPLGVANTTGSRIRYTPPATIGATEARSFAVEYTGGNGVDSRAGQIVVNLQDAALSIPDVTAYPFFGQGPIDIDLFASQANRSDLSVISLSVPNLSTLTKSGGIVTVTPNVAYSGPTPVSEQVTVLVSDGASTVSVTLTLAYEAGQLTVDDQNLSTSYGGTAEFSVEPGLAVVSVSQPTLGSASFSGSQITWTAPESGSGAQFSEFTYTVENNAGIRATGFVVVSVGAGGLTVENQAITTLQSTEVTITPSVTGGTAPYEIAITGQPASGSAAVNGSNIVYTSSDFFTGNVTIEYQVTDLMNNQQSGTITVTIAAGSGSLIETGEALAITSSGATVALPVVDVAYDENGGSISIDQSAVPQPSGGVAVLSGDDILYTPNAAVNATTALNYSLTNGVAVPGSVSIEEYAAKDNSTDLDLVVSVGDLRPSGTPFRAVSVGTTILPGESSNYRFTCTGGGVLVVRSAGSLSGAVSSDSGWYIWERSPGGNWVQPFGSKIIGGERLVLRSGYEYQINHFTSGLEMLSGNASFVGLIYPDAPTLPRGGLTTTEDTSVTLDLNSVQTNGGTIFTQVDAADNGAFVIGTETYTPNLGYTGSDSFAIRAENADPERPSVFYTDTVIYQVQINAVSAGIETWQGRPAVIPITWPGAIDEWAVVFPDGDGHTEFYDKMYAHDLQAIEVMGRPDQATTFNVQHQFKSRIDGTLTGITTTPVVQNAYTLSQTFLSSEGNDIAAWVNNVALPGQYCRVQNDGTALNIPPLLRNNLADAPIAIICDDNVSWAEGCEIEADNVVIMGGSCIGSQGSPKRGFLRRAGCARNTIANIYFDHCISRFGAGVAGGVIETRFDAGDRNVTAYCSFSNSHSIDTRKWLQTPFTGGELQADSWGKYDREFRNVHNASYVNSAVNGQIGQGDNGHPVRASQGYDAHHSVMASVFRNIPSFHVESIANKIAGTRVHRILCTDCDATAIQRLGDDCIWTNNFFINCKEGMEISGPNAVIVNNVVVDPYNVAANDYRGFRIHQRSDQDTSQILNWYDGTDNAVIRHNTIRLNSNGAGTGSLVWFRHEFSQLLASAANLDFSNNTLWRSDAGPILLTDSTVSLVNPVIGGNQQGGDSAINNLLTNISGAPSGSGQLNQTVTITWRAGPVRNSNQETIAEVINNIANDTSVTGLSPTAEDWKFSAMDASGGIRGHVNPEVGAFV